MTAFDFSRDIIKKAEQKFKASSITFMEMDAQHLQFEDEFFDRVIGSLILSVVAKADQAIHEMIRVKKRHSGFLIFDKFAPKSGHLSFKKRLIRPLISMLDTDTGLIFEKTIDPYLDSVRIVRDEPLFFMVCIKK
nr:class I SAM-dependent methyltransferase [Ammoniphilus oxalaticus]